MDIKKIGMIAASTVTLLGANVLVAAGPTLVKDHYCQNSNCKGHSDCAGMGSPAKGGNSCSGQGWLNKKSEAECSKAGGKWAMAAKEGAEGADGHKANETGKKK